MLAVKSGTYNGTTMVSALCRHGPTMLEQIMLEQMNQKNIARPVFKAGEMSDLMAWLNQGEKK